MFELVPVVEVGIEVGRGLGHVLHGQVVGHGWVHSNGIQNGSDEVIGSAFGRDDVHTDDLALSCAAQKILRDVDHLLKLVCYHKGDSRTVHHQHTFNKRVFLC